MFSPLKFALLITIFLTPGTHARTTFRGSSSSVGRIIVGCAVVGVALLFLFCLLTMMLRRRRLARQTPVNVDGQYQPPPQKPLFGGPWGRNNQNNATYSNQQQMNGGANYSQQPFGQNNMPPQGQQTPYNTEYPTSNAPAAPPAYASDKQGANGNGTYAPPPVPPPGGNNTQHFAPPPGPPPPAHTTGQDSSFVGGFRQ